MGARGSGASGRSLALTVGLLAGMHAGCRARLDDLEDPGGEPPRWDAAVPVDARPAEPPAGPDAGVDVAAPRPTPSPTQTTVVAPADVAGDYALDLTNGANGCELGGWIVGWVARGDKLRITQVGRGVTASFEGWTGLGLDWGPLGGHVYTGEVEGDRVRLQLRGARQEVRSQCAFTTESHVDARLDGDRLVGTVRFERVLPDAAACEALRCTSEQALDATREKR